MGSGTRQARLGVGFSEHGGQVCKISQVRTALPGEGNWRDFCRCEVWLLRGGTGQMARGWPGSRAQRVKVNTDRRRDLGLNPEALGRCGRVLGKRVVTGPVSWALENSPSG